MPHWASCRALDCYDAMGSGWWAFIGAPFLVLVAMVTAFCFAPAYAAYRRERHANRKLLAKRWMDRLNAIRMGEPVPQGCTREEEERHAWHKWKAARRLEEENDWNDRHRPLPPLVRTHEDTDDEGSEDGNELLVRVGASE